MEVVGLSGSCVWERGPTYSWYPSEEENDLLEGVGAKKLDDFLHLPVHCLFAPEPYPSTKVYL